MAHCTQPYIILLLQLLVSSTASKTNLIRDQIKSESEGKFIFGLKKNLTSVLPRCKHLTKPMMKDGNAEK